MKDALPYYRKRLREELSRRIENNPRYSLRSFAKALNVEPGALSQILLGKRFLSEKMIERLLKRIELTPEERSEFIHSVAMARKKHGLVRASPGLHQVLAEPTKPGSETEARDLTMDQFRVISDWYHFAILEMTRVKGFKPDARWISKRLGISAMEAKLALQRLIELELVENIQGRLIKTQDNFNTLDKSKTSTWHRRRQKQVLEKSLQSLENDPIEKRVHASVTFAIDPAKVTDARNRIQQFIWDMTSYMTQENQKSVYEMTVNLFPLEKGENS